MNEFIVNHIYQNTGFTFELDRLSTMSISAKDLVQRLLSIEGMHTQYIGKATKFNPSNGTPSQVDLVPYEPSEVKEIFLDNRYEARVTSGWFFLDKKLPIHEDVAAALQAMWKRSQKNVRYTVIHHDGGVSFQYVAVDTTVVRQGSYTDGSWSEHIRGITLERIRPAPEATVTILELTVEEEEFPSKIGKKSK